MSWRSRRFRAVPPQLWDNSGSPGTDSHAERGAQGHVKTVKQLTAAFVRTVTLPGRYGDQHGLI